MRFAGRTVNGGIEASGIKADAEAETVNGGVELDSTGTARAQTVNGGITARLGRADWEGTLKLETVNVGIEVSMPEGQFPDQQTDTQRIREIMELIALGWLSKIPISHDIGFKFRLNAHGGPGYAHILNNAVPMMKVYGP